MRWLVILILTGWGRITLKSEETATCHSERTKNFSYKLATDKNLTIESVKMILSSNDDGVSCVHVDLSGNNLSFLPADFFNIPLTSNIVSLNLSHNQLNSLDSLKFSYFRNLQELHVSHNALQVLKNGTFSDAWGLRVLDMSHNEISKIEVRAFPSGMNNLKKVDISFNRLQSYEQWQYLFSLNVQLDLSHNRISRFTNDLGILINREQYRNSVDLTYNNLTTLTIHDFAIYHGGTKPSIMQIALYGLNMENNPWICDCRIHWLVDMVSRSLVKINDKVDRILSCVQPPELKGKSFGYLVQCPDVLLCNVSQGCPEGCTCQDRPQRNYTLVDCDPSRRLYTRLPPILPSAPLLYLNLSGHQVRHLDDRVDYVPRLYGLNVANNHLTEVTWSFLDRASSLVLLDVRQNWLTSLPREARRFSIQHLKVVGNPFQCSCDFLWFGDWVRAVIANVSLTNGSLSSTPEGDMEVAGSLLPCGGDSESSSSMAGNGASDFWSSELNYRVGRDLSSLTCRTQDGETIALTEMSVDRLGCEQLAVGGIAAGCVVLLVLCAAVACWRRQYESKVLLFWVYRHCREACCKMRLVDVRKTGRPMQVNHGADELYDVYVSVDENDDAALNWVVRMLLPLLEERHMPLGVYLPIRQGLAGECIADARAKAILQSRNTLVLITAGYSRNPWCRYEFDFACRHLQEGQAGQLVLLNMANDDEKDDEIVDYEKYEENESNCPDCARGEDQHEAVGDGDFNPHTRAENLLAGPRRDSDDAQNWAPVGLTADDVVHADDGFQNTRRVLITVPDRSRSRGRRARDGRRFRLPCWRRRQQHPRPAERPVEVQRRHRAHRLARYCEHGEHMIAVEPLSTYLADGRFWRVSDWLLKQKLLYELSVVKTLTADVV